MRALAKNKQIICVTHLAQVAACGEKNFNISKKEKGQGTEVQVRRLEGEDIILEVARMIGSSEGAKAGYQHAADLIEEALSGDLK